MKLNHDYIRDILLYIENNLDYENDQTDKHKEITDGQLINADCFTNYNKQELTIQLVMAITLIHIHLFYQQIYLKFLLKESLKRVMTLPLKNSFVTMNVSN